MVKSDLPGFTYGYIGGETIFKFTTRGSPNYPDGTPGEAYKKIEDREHQLNNEEYWWCRLPNGRIDTVNRKFMVQAGEKGGEATQMDSINKDLEDSARLWDSYIVSLEDAKAALRKTRSPGKTDQAHMTRLNQMIREASRQADDTRRMIRE